MIGQMLVLLRLKELKQDNAFRAMRAKRTEVDDAKGVTARAHGRGSVVEPFPLARAADHAAGPADTGHPGVGTAHDLKAF